MEKYIAAALLIAITVAIGVSVFMGDSATTIQGGVKSIISDTITKLDTINP